jgi:DnaJ-class molecular chaperone
VSKYHKTLGVAPNASAEEIKSAYKKLAQELHPDKTGGDSAMEDRLKEVNEAYTELKKNNFAAPRPDIGDVYDKWYEPGGHPRTVNRMHQQVAVSIHTIMRGGSISFGIRLPNVMLRKVIEVPIHVNIPPLHPIDQPILAHDEDDLQIFITVVPQLSGELKVDENKNLVMQYDIEIERLINRDPITLFTPCNKRIALKLPEEQFFSSTRQRVRGYGLPFSFGRSDLMVEFRPIIGQRDSVVKNLIYREESNLSRWVDGGITQAKSSEDGN